MNETKKSDEDFEKELKNSVAPEEKKSLRRKIFKLSLQDFTHIFKTGKEIKYYVDKGFPEDARVVDVCPDIFTSGIVSFLVESDSFEEVQEGKPFPMDEEGIIITTLQ